MELQELGVGARIARLIIFYYKRKYKISKKKIKILAVTSARENVLDAVRSLGKGVFKVLLFVGLLAAESADVRAECRLHLARQLAVRFLVEDENVVGFWHGVEAVAERGVDLAGLTQELLNPHVCSINSAWRSCGVVFHQVEESTHVAFDLVQSLFSV